MPYLFELLKMGALAAFLALVFGYVVGNTGQALIGVGTFYLLLVKAS